MTLAFHTVYFAKIYTYGTRPDLILTMATYDCQL